ncbi:MAG: tetratricopeptide repeat protein [bacterium]|nr:tetratricopeptide repeat protein [bacterium]
MKGYRYYHKRKSVKLKIFFIVLLSAAVIYILIKSINILPLFQSRKIDYKSIQASLYRYDAETDRMERKILLNKTTKWLNKITSGMEEIHDSNLLYFLGSINLRRALLEYNKELRNMYLDKAVYYFRKALVFIKDNKGLSVVHFELGKSYFYKGEYYYYESLLELETAAKLGYDKEKTGKIVSFIRFKTGDISEINELIGNFRESRSGTVENYFYDAHTYKNNKDNRKSQETFLKVLEYFSRNPVRTEEEKYIFYRTLYSLGWLCFEKGDYKSSLEYYKKVLVYDEKDADVYYWLGKVYQAVKNTAQARKMWEKVLEIDPHHQNAKNKLKSIKRGK